MPFLIGEGLNESDLPLVQAKVAQLVSAGKATKQQLAHWCEAKGECACMGCANRHLEWAEWECWRKYDPGICQDRLSISTTSTLKSLRSTAKPESGSGALG